MKKNKKYLYKLLEAQEKKILLVNKDNYVKVIGCLSVCVCVQKDLANHWTDKVFLYNEASHRSREGSYNHAQL